jgi:hypothetical protein
MKNLFAIMVTKNLSMNQIRYLGEIIPSKISLLSINPNIKLLSQLQVQVYRQIIRNSYTQICTTSYVNSYIIIIRENVHKKHCRSYAQLCTRSYIKSYDQTISLTTYKICSRSYILSYIPSYVRSYETKILVNHMFKHTFFPTAHIKLSLDLTRWHTFNHTTTCYEFTLTNIHT